MVHRLINATEAKAGTVIIIDGEACTVRSMDVSKTGKHGHAKCRISAIGIISGKKKVIAVPGHDRLEVPLILKKRAQILSIGEVTVNVMDLESYETFDIPFDEEIKNDLKPEVQVEYWDVEGIKVIKKVL